MKEVIKENRAAHIIRHAQEVFFKKGYSMTAISDVCKLAECSRTTLYSYFDSKENLYLAVVKKAFVKFLGHFAKIDLTKDTGLDRILNLSVGYLDFVQFAPKHYQLILDFYNILRSINEAAGSQTEFQANFKACELFDEVDELAQIPFQLLVSEIKQGQKDGTIDKSTLPLTHLINIWAYLKGISEVSPLIGNIDRREDKSSLENIVVKTIRGMLTKEIAAT